MNKQKSITLAPMNSRGFFLEETDRQCVWHPFALPHSSNIVIKKARGVYLYDQNNKKYIDAVSSWWVNMHGHGNTQLKNALSRQFRKTDHIIFSGFTHEPGIRLAKTLLEKTGKLFDKVFYSDNGSTSVEVALKLAIQFLVQQDLKKICILSLKDAYHGDTFGAMAAGGKTVFNAPFSDFLFETVQIPVPAAENLPASLKLIEELQAANDAIIFIYEPLIQGAGGMNVYSAELLNRLLDQIRKKKAVCIADEVMTGFYRTGTFVASETITQKPDMLCLSKGITGGMMPLGVTLISDEIVNAFKDKTPAERFYHGHSYTGNPLACALALESFKLFDKKKLDNIASIHKQHTAFAKKIEASPKIKRIGICGTILRFEIVTKENSGYTNSLRDRIYDWFIENGILIRPLGNVVYIMPPYNIQPKELNMIYRAIEKFLENQLH